MGKGTAGTGRGKNIWTLAEPLPSVQVMGYLHSSSMGRVSYLSTRPENVKDPLLWWVEMHAVYPCLSWMACNYLSIPGIVNFFKFVFEIWCRFYFYWSNFHGCQTCFQYLKANLSFPMSITYLAWHQCMHWCILALEAGSDWCKRLISKLRCHFLMLLERKMSLTQDGITWLMIKCITCTPAYNILTHASTPNGLLTLATLDTPIPVPVNYPDPHGGYGFW